MSSPYPSPYAPGSPPAPTDADRTWAVVAHAGSFVAAWLALGILAPLLVLLLRSGSPWVREHALESVQFQANALFWIVVAVVLSFVGIGLLLFPVIGVAYLVLVIRATVKANRGERYRYPLTLHFLS